MNDDYLAGTVSNVVPNGTPADPAPSVPDFIEQARAGNNRALAEAYRRSTLRL